MVIRRKVSGVRRKSLVERKTVCMFVSVKQSSLLNI